VDAVVHLAFIRPAGPGPHQRYLAERANIDLAYMVYQLALDEGVRRVVVARSNHAADSYEGALRERRLDMIYPDSPRPLADHFYGWSKEAYEHLGFVYATGHLGQALEVVQPRIGAPRDLAATSFVDPGRTAAKLHRDLGMWISPRDLAQLVVRSIETPEIRDRDGVPFQVFHGISGNTRAAWSIANARRVIGYAPEDDSEVVYTDEIRAHLIGPARAAMVTGPARGGRGHRDS
jgi:nucleoside-diphosphate-sugar epimerase